MIHGLNDKWLMPEGLHDTWRYLEKELTQVTVPNAGHWVHHDAADLVTRRLVTWLTQE
jgi:pimeloyl-ACP methyl ester carboxylesterase